jgi:hypothetical protein
MVRLARRELLRAGLVLPPGLRLQGSDVSSDEEACPRPRQAYEVIDFLGKVGLEARVARAFFFCERIMPHETVAPAIYVLLRMSLLTAHFSRH